MLTSTSRQDRDANVSLGGMAGWTKPTLALHPSVSLRAHCTIYTVDRTTDQIAIEEDERDYRIYERYVSNCENKGCKKNQGITSKQSNDLTSNEVTSHEVTRNRVTGKKVGRAKNFKIV